MRILDDAENVVERVSHCGLRECHSRPLARRNISLRRDSEAVDNLGFGVL